MTDIDKFQRIFFRKLGAHPNWSVDQLREIWLLAENELFCLEEQDGKCPMCGFKK